MFAPAPVHSSVAADAAVAYLTPFFGVIFSWLLIGDRLGATEIFGGLLVVAGVAVLSTDRR